MAYLPSRIWKVTRFFFRIYCWLTRPMTLGVRALVRDEQGRILLVRHTYVDGWYLPGGGVERSETVWTSVERELREEAGVTLFARPRFAGLYANFREFRSDHVALFVVEPGTYAFAPARNLEIAEAAFFPAAELPEGTTRATRERISEFLAGSAASEQW